jgi:hypothetical protein
MKVKYFFPFWGGVEKSPLLLRPLLAYCTSPGWWWVWNNRWNDWQGKHKYSEKTRLSAALSTTNRTWPDPGSRGGKPATIAWGTHGQTECLLWREIRLQQIEGKALDLRRLFWMLKTSECVSDDYLYRWSYTEAHCILEWTVELLIRNISITWLAFPLLEDSRRD